MLWNSLQSVSSEQKVNALVANFVSLPAGENVDWRLSATTSPCHVTVISLSLIIFHLLTNKHSGGVVEMVIG